MTVTEPAGLPTPFRPLPALGTPWRVALLGRAEAVLIPVAALMAGAAGFALFIAVLGKSPLDLATLIYQGGFGSWFSLQNSMQRAAPLLLAALCVAAPARLGLVIIGGEGAIVLGGLAAAAAALPLHNSPLLASIGMALAAVAAGALWIGAIGWLRHYRGVNETIASLLLAYIAIALMNHLVEGPLRDPASLNKPSTRPIGPELMIGSIPGLDVHWGFAAGILACIGIWFLLEQTTLGFSARIAGANIRAAQVQGLPVGRLILVITALGGAMAGLAGMYEVAAVHGSANASLVAGYGYTGILVSFLARHNPLAIIPVSILFGGIAASGGLIQRRMGLPDATILVLQGFLFIAVLISETFYGRRQLTSSPIEDRA